MSDICPGCGTALTDCGPVGVACLNRSCTYEMDAALKWLRQQNEANENLGILSAEDVAMYQEAIARAEAAEAKMARLEVTSKALASWCAKNIMPNYDMDNHLHALDAALTEGTPE